MVLGVCFEMRGDSPGGSLDPTQSVGPNIRLPQNTVITEQTQDVGSMLAYYLRRWPNISSTMGQRKIILVFCGTVLLCGFKYTNGTVKYTLKSKYTCYKSYVF